MTDYNGSISCEGCGKSLDPAFALHSHECWNCKKARYKEALEKRMAP